MTKTKVEKLDEARSRLSEEQRSSENADHYDELDDERRFTVPPDSLDVHEEGDGPSLTEILAGESTVDDEDDAETTSTPGEDGEDNQEEQES